MEINTYFWEDRVVSHSRVAFHRFIRWRASHYFSQGNAGDIFAKQILLKKYKCSINNTQSGRRILPIGSIAHKILNGDLLCGIGTKGEQIPSANDVRCKIWGLRGPITLEEFRKTGHDVSGVKFLMDPGLLIRFMVDENRIYQEKGKDIIFIPHYRERDKYRTNPVSGIDFVDIDSDPMVIANKILNSRLVYTSSLHGIIFAHALKRPCVFVKPQTKEPLLKYKDYFSSVDLKYQKPVEDIYKANLSVTPDSPAEVNYKECDFQFPSLSDLEKLGIAH